MATSALWDLLDALVATFRTDPTLTAANVAVFDGPPITDLSAGNLLFVGAAPNDADDSAPDAVASQQWGELGARAKYEDLQLRCELWVVSGSVDMPARRQAAKTLLDAVENALRADFTLGVGHLLWIHLAGLEVRQMQTQGGSSVAATFTLAARARLS